MDELIAQLEAASGPCRELDFRIFELVRTDAEHSAYIEGKPYPSYTASLDAAFTLIPKGAHCGMGYDSPPEGVMVGKAWAWVRFKVDGRWEETPLDWKGPRPRSMALALCAAALRARAVLERKAA